MMYQATHGADDDRDTTNHDCNKRQDGCRQGSRLEKSDDCSGKYEDSCSCGDYEFAGSNNGFVSSKESCQLTPPGGYNNPDLNIKSNQSIISDSAYNGQRH